MTNAELINKLRILQVAILNPHHRGGEYVDKRFADVCVDAADALEAAEKRIAELESNNPIVESVLVDKLNQRIDELEAQLPKEGEWIEANTRPRSAQFYCSVCHRTCYDIQPTRDKAWTKRCRYNYCPNCGARMRKGEQDGC